jgi:hypothetical protein
MSKDVLHAPVGKTDSDIRKETRGVQTINDCLSVEAEGGGP